MTCAGTCVEKRPPSSSRRNGAACGAEAEALVAVKQSCWETCRQNWCCLPCQLCYSSWLCGCIYAKTLIRAFLLQGISSGIS